ncbi:MAG: plasmid maintenance system killer protein [Parachlamydia sp.]|nr:MAG: plasmid maintenance system killer protein [Parachlamydia sp.]
MFDGINSKNARKKLDPSLYSIACRKLDMLDAAVDLNDLRIPPSNRLEALKENLKNKYSIRINDQYRIIFAWGDLGADQVEIIDYH